MSFLVELWEGFLILYVVIAMGMIFLYNK